LTAAAKTAGASKSDNTANLTYNPGTGSAFCVAAKSNSSGGTVFYATDSSGATKVTTANPLPSSCTAP
jgi:hypothetical protein